MNQILIIDDVPSICEQYAYDLRRLGPYEVVTATSGEQGLACLEQEPIDCVILDLEMPGMDGFGVLKQLRKLEIDLPVIVYTGTGNYDRCTRAIRDGAYSFIDKAEPMERVVREIENALEKQQLTSELTALRERSGENGPLIGNSPAMMALRSDIARLAPIPRPVLILGESGTGKELVARELHRLSDRVGNAFLPINCAALSDNLVESELFGHEAGAYTGAKRMQKGAFEAVSDGTLFLDEIGELPLTMQGVFLRVLEESKITRVRGTRQVPIETRVVAATNRDLETEIGAGRFRQDLFYRLSVHLIRVPPLRDRLADVPSLAEHFLARVAADYKRRDMRLSAGGAARLQTYDWRANNVRELRNVIERLVSFCRDDLIDEKAVIAELEMSRAWGNGVAGALAAPGATDQWERITGLAPEQGAVTLRERKADAEREIIRAALNRNGGQIGKTAAELGLADHSSLLKIIKRLGIK